MTKEHLGHKFQVSAVDLTVDTHCRLNIKKRYERVVYRTTTIKDNINLAFVQGRESAPRANLFISDRSTSLAQNRVPTALETKTGTVGSLTLSVDKFLVTDVFTTAAATQAKTPLFYYHTLENYNEDNDDWDDKTLLSIKFTDQNLIPVAVTDYYTDTTNGYIYNNIENTYDVETGEANVYFIQYSVKVTSGASQVVTVYHELINNSPAFQLADFSHLDDLGILDPTVKRYLLEESISGQSFTITLPTTKEYAWKETPASRLRVIQSDTPDTSNPWHVRVSNGKFISTLKTSPVASRNFKYYVAEFNSQTYVPFPPYKMIQKQQATWISDKLIKVPRGVLFDVGIGLFTDLIVKDSTNTLKAAITNNPDKIGDVYQGDIDWENSIASLDESGGFIELTEKLESTDEIIATYFIEESEYEFTSIDFNPVNNLDILRQRIVLYINPETSSTGELDKSLYFLVVDPTGKIIYSSQAEENAGGSDPATTKLIAEDFNTSGIPTHTFYYDIPSTDEGLTSRASGGLGDIEEFSFIDKYTVDSVLINETTTNSGTLGGFELNNYESNPRFLVLGDLYTDTDQSAEGLVAYDVRKRGGGIKDEDRELSLNAQAEVSWYWDIGQEKTYPGMGAFYVEVPKSVNEGFGGVFDKDQVRTIVEKHMQAGGYPVVRYYGYDPVIIDTVSTSGTIGFEWPSYGPGRQYNVYLSSDNKEFVLMSGAPYTDAGVGNDNSLSIPGLIPGTEYYVYVAAINDDGYDEAGPVVKILSRANDF